jgi:mRNA-degrading endonuclease toxin of MazEF toxin-antitoxin module
MTGFERWDVITALFPFTESVARKPRPVLVISRGEFNRAHGHLVGCMITTGARSSWPTDHSIVDLEASGLNHPSVVRWKVFTLPFAAVGRRIGGLVQEDRDAVSAIMGRVFGST